MKRLVFQKYLSAELFILLAILALALFLRLQGVANGLFAYTYDVGRDLLAVSAIVHQHKIPLIGPTTGFEGIFYGPWWYYILTLPFVVFGGNPKGIAFFMALLGTLAVGISYYTGKRIQGRTFGVVFALLFAVSPILISNQIWNPYLAIPVIALLLYCLTFIFDKKTQASKMWFFVIGICLGLILDSEIFFGMLFCIGTVLAILIIKRLRFSVLDILYFILGFIVILLPRILFDLRHQFLLSKHFIYLLTHGIAQNHYTPFVSRLHYLFVEIFGQQWSDTLAGSNVVLGGILFILALILLVIFYKKNSHLENAFILYSSVVTAVFFFYFLTNSTDVFSHFIVGLPVLYVLFFAIAIILLLRVNYGKIILPLFIAILVVVLLNPVKVLNGYIHPWQGDASVYKNQFDVVKYVYTDAQNRPFKVVTFTPNGIDYTYRYLFDWYGKNQHQLPDDSAKLAYYILEPDTQYKGYRLNIFKTQHQNDGKLLFEKTIAGGIAVQKREF